MEPGDVFVTNDPYYGGVTHLNDIVVAMPVFVDNRIIAWTANIAHNSDVGGKSRARFPWTPQRSSRRVCGFLP